MRTALSRSHIRFVGILAGLAVLLTVAATLASGAQSAHPARASLVVTSRSPVAVRGTGFTPLRRVQVTVFAPRRLVRRPLANRQGTFTASFPGTVIDRCSAWMISATQPGRAPVILRGAKPMCPVASTP